MPSGEPGREDPAPLTVFIRFELLVLIRVDKLLATGFGLSLARRQSHGRFRAHPPAHDHRRQGTRRLHPLRHHHPAA